jgi:starch phosphorylase
MFVLALRMAQDCNGVSRLHGEVSRRMWKDVWPGVPEDEVPITHVTNGVHITSWLSRENFLLLENYLGQNWCEHPHDADIQASIDNIYDDELWRAHSMNHLSLINFCRKRLRQQYERRNASKAEMKELENMLDPDALTIGFARRFATYKRADLITRDFERLKQIIMSADYPIQLIFAGKAHPMDNEGKALIQHIVNDICKSELRHKIIFIEDYDINVARYLVQGVDVWLNTPRRPMEACGTSGMKAAINGVLNVSILDGWWCEGYSPECGWSIGGGEEYRDHEYQDSMESQALYNLFENDVVPCFYERKSGGIPYKWVRMMKESMKMSIHNFCSHRMVNDYKTQFYMPAAKRYKELLQNNAEKAKMPAVQRKRLHDNWEKIRIEPPAREKDGPYRVSETLRITVRVLLEDLTPDEVRVQLYYGIWQSIGSIQQGNTEEMSILKDYGNGEYLYECFIKCGQAGRYGFTARVTPQGDQWIHFAPGLITWA